MPEQAESLSERLIVPMTPSMIAAIREFRFKHRFDSRADAVRELIKNALECDKNKEPRE